jgi:hypothetical protein
MSRILLLVSVLLAAVGAAGCAGTQRSAASSLASVAVPPDRPPSPATWPAYPRFSARSCWTRPFGSGVMRAAPSAKPSLHPQPRPPAVLVRGLLARLGDRRLVHAIQVGPPPPITLMHLRGYFAGARPPADALWAYIAAPAASARLGVHPTPAQVRDQFVAGWEAGLVAGALRDDFCAAGGRPLVGWTVGRGGISVSDRIDALEQRFPNPSPAAFRKLVALVGRRYGFRVVSLRLLRPRQLAPLLVVETGRDRKAFVHDVPAIMALLDPTSSAGQQTAITFEGFLFEARDAKGAFVRVEDVYRGEVEGGQWSWNRCDYPYPHSEPLGAKPCP